MLNKGKKYKLKFEEVICSETNRKMLRLTPKEYLCHHPYFYNKIFTSDGSKMIFASDMSGERNYYLLDLRTMEATQLTDSNDVCDFSGCISNDDSYMSYMQEGNVMKLSLDTLEEEIIYYKKDDWYIGGPPSFSSDGKYLITTQSYKKDSVTPSGDPWRDFLEQGKIGYRSRLVLTNLETKEDKILIDTINHNNLGLKKNQWLTHPLIRPNDNNFISCCHEGLGGTVDARIWFTDSLGSHWTCAREHDIPGQIISHEFWYKDGSRLGYVRIDKPKIFNNGKLCSLNPKNLEEEIIADLPRCSHFITSCDDTMVVADGAMPDEQFMTPELVKDEDMVKPEDLFIYLVDLNNGNYQRLVAHKSSFKTYGHSQDTHPHPTFTPDNKSIVFTSDFEGLPAIYLVDIN